MSNPFGSTVSSTGQGDSKHLSSPPMTMPSLPNYQGPQPSIYVQQHPPIMATPMLQPQSTGTTQIIYPPQPVQLMMNPAQLYSPTQPTTQFYPPTMQQNPMMMQNPVIMQQPQYIQPLTPAPTGELYRAQLYAGCANGQHQWNIVYGPVGIITAIICFPIGLLALLVDKKNVCMRCQTSVPA